MRNRSKKRNTKSVVESVIEYNRNSTKPHPLTNIVNEIADEIVNDIIKKSESEILKAVKDEYGDESYLANKTKEIIKECKFNMFINTDSVQETYDNAMAQYAAKNGERRIYTVDGNTFVVVSEPGDMTLYDYLLWTVDGETFECTARRSTFDFPKVIHKDEVGITDIAKRDKANPCTVAEVMAAIRDIINYRNLVDDQKVRRGIHNG